MQIQGTVISYTAATKIAKKGGGSYDAWELVYRSPENEVKQLAKPVQSLKFTKGLKESLASLSPNDEFTAVLEKNANDYWEVQEVTKGVVASEPNVPAAPVEAGKPADRPVQAQRAVNRVVGNTYETAEERAKKQVVIVRQSCIGYALELVPEGDRNVETISEVAEKLEKHVFKGLKAAAKKYLDVKLTDEEPKVE